MRNRYAPAVAAYRWRARKANTALVVVIDADTSEVSRREQQLAESLCQAELESRSTSEAIVHLIPKRNIETWILYLSGEIFDEITDYHGQSNIDTRVLLAATGLVKWWRSRDEHPAHYVPSLNRALRELQRLK